MTHLEAITAARRLARYCREQAETSGRWRVWRDRALLLESAAHDMEREAGARLSWPERVRELLEGRRPAHGADPFGHRRPRTLEPARLRVVRRDEGPGAA
jgi:hypothetical protein